MKKEVSQSFIKQSKLVMHEVTHWIHMTEVICAIMSGTISNLEAGLYNIEMNWNTVSHLPWRLFKPLYCVLSIFCFHSISCISWQSISVTLLSSLLLYVFLKESCFMLSSSVPRTVPSITYHGRHKIRKWLHNDIIWQGHQNEKWGNVKFSTVFNKIKDLKIPHQWPPLWY